MAQPFNPRRNPRPPTQMFGTNVLTPAGAKLLANDSVTSSRALTIVTITATSYTVGDEDVIDVDDDTAAAEVTLALPPVATASRWPREVKKLGSTANVVLDPDGSELIEGASSLTLTVKDESVTILTDGVRWRIR